MTNYHIGFEILVKDITDCISFILCYFLIKSRQFVVTPACGGGDCRKINGNDRSRSRCFPKTTALQ